MLHRAFARLPACLAVVAAVASPAPAQQAHLTVRDDRGRTLSIESPPSRIVSLVPVVTEILFRLGQGRRLVGRSAYDDFPAEAAGVPNVGDAIRPSMELVLARRPDLVILVAGSDNASAADELDRLGVPALAVEINSLPDLERNIRRLGALTDVEEGAARLWREIVSALDSVAARVQGRAPRSVYYDVAYPPMITVGAGSYLDTLISICGGRNVFGDLAAPSPQVSLEALAVRDPDLVVYPVTTTSPSSLPPARRPGWEVVEAVRRGAIVQVNGDLLNRLGPRVGEAARQLSRALHPEAFLDVRESDR